MHALVSQFTNVVKSSNSSAQEAILLHLRTHGGYSSLIQEQLEVELSKFLDNPRFLSSALAIRREMELSVVELRSQIQTFINKTILESNHVNAKLRPSNIAAPGNATYLPTVNSEFPLIDEQYPLEGHLDLLKIAEDFDEIVDFKTGKEIKDSFWIQLKTYSWLWSRSVLNKNKNKKSVLTVLLGNGESESIDFSMEQLITFGEEFEIRLKEAQSFLDSKNAIANVSPGNCKYCPVKVLCSDYWKDVPNHVLTNSAWTDVQVLVVSNLGASNYKVTISPSNENAVFVADTHDEGDIQVGQVLHLLGVRIYSDEEESRVIRMNSSSEIFTFRSPLR